MTIDESIKILSTKPDPSGKYSNESFIKNNFKDVYDIVISYIELSGISFSQKVWHFLNKDFNLERKCKMCDNNVNFISTSKGYQIYCSRDCMYKDKDIKIKKEETNICKFGVKYPSQSETIKEKTKDKLKEIYGDENYNNLEQCKKTKKERYNNEFYNNKEKIKETKQLKYSNSGYNNINKIKETNNIRYGVDYSTQSDIMKVKSKETKQLRYDDENYTNIEQQKNTMILLYNVDNASRSSEIQKKKRNNHSKKLLNNIDNLIEVDYDNLIYKIYCKECDSIFDISFSLYHNRKSYKTTLCTNCNKLNSGSGMQNQLLNFIIENYDGTIIINDRKEIKLEIDIYLSDLKIGLEFNGIYWHNELYKKNDYHKEKSDLCRDKNIKLIQVWEDDWLYKREIIESIILDNLKKTKNIIYAIKCEIKEVSNKDTKIFLDNNHLQGNIKSSIRIGLYYDSELVSLMIFDKTNDEYELLRFCNKLNTDVIGYTSKLFKYFIKKYNPKKVISYVDRSYFDGDLYIELGFNLDSTTDTNCYYVIDHKRVKMDIVKEGYFKIYDAGNYKFKYVK